MRRDVEHGAVENADLVSSQNNAHHNRSRSPYWWHNEFDKCYVIMRLAIMRKIKQSEVQVAP